jgi:hypothetical protein
VEAQQIEGEALARAVLAEIAALEAGEDGMTEPLDREDVVAITLPSVLSAAARSSSEDKQPQQEQQEQQQQGQAEQGAESPNVASEGGLVSAPDYAAAANAATAVGSPSAASPVLPTADFPSIKAKKKSLGERLRSMFKKRKKKKAETMASSK